METASSQRPLSRLESLPGELRNTIYRYAVIEDSPVIAANLVDKQAKSWRSHQPALSLTCKQIRDEVLPIYYSENAFTFRRTPEDTYKDDDYLHNAIAWLRSTGKYCALVQRVGVTFAATSKGKDGNVQRKESSITATVSNLQILSTTKYHFSQNLNPPCKCSLVPTDDLQKEAEDRRKRIMDRVNSCVFLHMAEIRIKLRRLKLLTEAMASCCEGTYEEYAKPPRRKDCTNCGGRKTWIKPQPYMLTREFRELFGPLPDE
ncbi:hypothetical protein LTR37_007298 [Vermiconidia calcicola]|uniref:Uncharacterized protein n=1 Tax=Vermiconidia calcicola TaxID=1690605 RepID=A0ACC3NGJ1_9PEZI|nr:hypothetical protein LTR37_007298 [Vermiconidia calcicola]